MSLKQGLPSKQGGGLDQGEQQDQRSRELKGAGDSLIISEYPGEQPSLLIPCMRHILGAVLGARALRMKIRCK